MRFRSHKTETFPKLPEHRRLIRLLGAIGFCLLALQLARRDSSWYWLTSPATDPTENSVPSKPDVDFRVALDDESIGSGLRVARPAVGEGPVASESVDAEASDLTIDPQLLTVIKDNSVGIRDSEREFYFYLLAKVSDAPEKTLRRAARDDVAFAVLMSESKQFLGQLLTIKGEVRRLTPVPAGLNDYGVERLYEAWLFNSDSGLNPYRVFCTNLPEGIPTGMELKPGTVVEATGYYFKRIGYPTADNRLHVAPLLLAKTLSWQRPAAVRPVVAGSLMPSLVAGLASVIGLLAFVLWRLKVGDRRFEEQFIKRLKTTLKESISDIPLTEALDINATLRQLSEAHAAADSAKTRRASDALVATMPHPESLPGN